METPYEYTPLDNDTSSFHFRLLRLYPSIDFEAQIECDVFNSTFEEAPEYEPVSYAWGDPRLTEEIMFGGKRHIVTTNLRLALRYLRLSDSERILWVDALCINQQDVQEKNRQVRQMRQIYVNERVKQVLAWLGEEEEDARAVLELTARMKREPPLKAFYENERVPEMFDSLFVNRPWLKRLWVVQEVAHSRPVIICLGHLQVEFDSFWDSCGQLSSVLLYDTDHKRPDTTPMYGHLSCILRPWKAFGLDIWLFTYCGRGGPSFVLEKIHRLRTIISGHNQVSLIDLFYILRQQESDDPKDKIFALLGMAHPQEFFFVNYELSKRELYIIYARNMMKSSLKLLVLVGRIDRAPILGDPDLPSWIPDLHHPDITFATAMYQLYDHFDASASAIPPSSQNSDADILILHGVHIGIITGVHTTLFQMFDPGSPRNDFTLIRFTDVWRQEKEPEIPWITDGVDIDNTSWGPRWAEVGDIIIAAAGSNVPLVLRKVSNNLFLLIGPCCLIDGELQVDFLPPKIDRLLSGYSRFMFRFIRAVIGDEYKLEEFRIA